MFSVELDPLVLLASFAFICLQTSFNKRIAMKRDGLMGEKGEDLLKVIHRTIWSVFREFVCFSVMSGDNCNREVNKILAFFTTLLPSISLEVV